MARAAVARQPELRADVDPRYQQFVVQKANAGRRGISWHFQFWEWLQIWEESGHFEERGTHKGQWCMSRFGDIGAYETGNVRITRVETNAREANETKAIYRVTKLKEVS